MKLLGDSAGGCCCSAVESIPVPPGDPLSRLKLLDARPVQVATILAAPRIESTRPLREVALAFWPRDSTERQAILSVWLN
ncbi:MAG: hypothetical protein U1D55_08340 [Phycisphaerae bacterium]